MACLSPKVTWSSPPWSCADHRLFSGTVVLVAEGYLVLSLSWTDTHASTAVVVEARADHILDLGQYCQMSSYDRKALLRKTYRRHQLGGREDLELPKIEHVVEATNV